MKEIHNEIRKRNKTEERKRGRKEEETKGNRRGKREETVENGTMIPAHEV
jgi:hypothetical protein